MSSPLFITQLCQLSPEIMPLLSILAAAVLHQDLLLSISDHYSSFFTGPQLLVSSISDPSDIVLPESF